MTEYEIRPLHGNDQNDDQQLLAATRLCFPALPRWSRQARQIIRSAPEQLGVDFHCQIVALEPLRNQLAACCLYVLMPGRGATVLSPQFATHTTQDDRDRLGPQLVRQAIEQCRLKNAVLIQALLDPQADSAPAKWFAAAGFRFMASLIYMQRSVSATDQPQQSADDPRWQWTSYADHSEQTIGELIERSYTDTLDCPELENIRSWQEVIESHKSSGIFDPRGWNIALRDGRPAGLALVNRMTGRNACELVYMGVDPAFRGQGLGRVLVQKALDSAHLLNCPLLTLAVDTRNKPAIAVYEDAGFIVTGRRDAWFVPPPGR